MKLALLALAALAALVLMSGRRLRVEPVAPAPPPDDVEWLQSFRITPAWEGPINQMPPGRWAYPRHEVN